MAAKDKALETKTGLFSFAWTGTSLSKVPADVRPLLHRYCRMGQVKPIMKPHDSYRFKIKFGSFGQEPGQWDNPQGLVVDKSGNLWVADTGNHRIQVVTQDGELVKTFGKEGSGDGEFKHPCGLAFDFDDNLVVVEYGNHRFQVFDGDLNFLFKVGGPTAGSGEGQFNWPYNVGIDNSGNIIVCDSTNNRLQFFNSSGVFLKKFDMQDQSVDKVDCEDDAYTCVPEPMGVAVDSKGNFLVTQGSTHRIQLFDPNGKALKILAPEGRGAGEVMSPHGIVVDRFDKILMADGANHRIQMFSEEGQFLRRITSKYEMRSPPAVAFTKEGDIVVLDPGMNRIQIFA